MSKFRVLILTILMLALVAMPSMAQEDIVFMRFFGVCDDEFGDNTDLEAAFGECGIIQTLANAFNASQDAVAVETIPVDWPGVTELNANLAAGTPPEIMVLHGNRIPGYAQRGLLTPLGDVLEAAGIDISDLTDSARGFVEWNGEIYGIPLDLHGHIWHINLDLWAEAGLVNDDGTPAIPVGEEEFFAAAEQFKEATGLPFVGFWTNGMSRNWMALVYQQNASIETEDGSPNINTAEGLAALEFMMKIRDEGHMVDDVDYTAAQEVFLNCEDGSHINGTWVVNFYDEQVADPEGCLDGYYVANFPQIFDRPAAWANSHSWILPQGLNPDPVKLEATLQFLKYLYDNNINWSRTGHATVRNSVLASDEYNNLPHRDEYADFVPTAIIQPRSNWSTAFENVLDEELQAAWIGDKTPQQALDDAQARLEDIAIFGS